MGTMKVVKAFGPQDLRIVNVPIPEPGPGQVRIKVRASGICGSDKWVWSVNGPSESIAGHEVAGEVDKLGEGVHTLAVGDPIMINNVGGCGTCPACRGGAFVLCTTWNGSLDINNGFGEYVIAHARNCMKLLPGIDFIDGALIMDNWGTPYGGVLRGNVKAGTDVMITGLGPIGQAAIGLCKMQGAFVIAVDPIKWRRDMALKNGADIALHPDDAVAQAKALTEGLGVEVVLECSGNGKAYDSGLKALRNEGTLISIGEEAEFEFHPSHQLIRRALKIVGSWYSTMPQGAEIMQLALNKRINLRSFLTHTITLDEVPGMFGQIMDCADGIMKCVIVFD